MAVLGLILLAAAGVLTAAVVTSNTDSLAVDLWGVTVSNVTLGVVFVAGMITTVLAVIGLGLLMGGVRRTRRLRKERKSLRRENEQLIQRVESSPTSPEPTGQRDEPTVVDHPRTDRPYDERPYDGQPYDGQPYDDRTRTDRTHVDRPVTDTPPTDHRPAPAAVQAERDSAGSSSAGTTTPRRRSFLPRREQREDRPQQETVSRDV